MDASLILWILAVILTVTGLAGLLLPMLPGAPLLFLGLLCGAWAEDFRHVGLIGVVGRSPLFPGIYFSVGRSSHCQKQQQQKQSHFILHVAI